ncbi:MAG: hypothetical protein Q4P78_01940 [Rothia sp. (in: high G+C Gram-positive bacteria)]|uniref:hypothetical protein n=1 Tax=Rothia sp. (in: high G+C Gram-positive bacteria) TaxID=1885016 RepID=UPI0026E0F596|nr:hypothetical protein [Rothia sp. (in: high G+C Gram-positive bacteria)]MDO5749946.1 hypothetical protein [Rothia sp. (in: high G+C Gram-positive bacteria)]
MSATFSILDQESHLPAASRAALEQAVAEKNSSLNYPVLSEGASGGLLGALSSLLSGGSAQPRLHSKDLDASRAALSLLPLDTTLSVDTHTPIVYLAEGAEDFGAFGALTRANVSKLARIIVPSRAAKDKLLAACPYPSESIQIIPAPLSQSPSRTRAPRDLSDKTLHVLLVARESKPKALAMALRAVEEASQKRTIELSIAAPESMHATPVPPLGSSSSVTWIEDSAVQLGSEESTALLIAQDLLLVPDGAGEKELVLYALACGVPVVGQRHEDIASLPRRDRSGWLYLPEMTEAKMAKHMLELSPAQINEASAWALKDSAERYSYTAWASSVLELLNSLG